MLADLIRRLRPLETGTSSFGVPVPAQDARDARWIEPRLVGEVMFTEWTTGTAPDTVLCGYISVFNTRSASRSV
jgi:ATP-dependent DNA ligase